MPIKFKFDILEALKKAGYNTYRLKKEHILAESTIQKLRHNQMVSIENISRSCGLLRCQPGDIIEYQDE